MEPGLGREDVGGVRTVQARWASRVSTWGVGAGRHTFLSSLIHSTILSLAHSLTHALVHTFLYSSGSSLITAVTHAPLAARPPPISAFIPAPSCSFTHPRTRPSLRFRPPYFEACTPSTFACPSLSFLHFLHLVHFLFHLFILFSVPSH